MDFCEEKIEWTELIDLFQEVYNNYSDIDKLTPLQGIALARQLTLKLEELIEKIKQISLQKILCKVLESMPIEEKIKEVTNDIDDIFEGLEQLQDFAKNINPEEMAISEIQNQIQPYVDTFVQYRDNKEEYIDEILIQLFEPLIELGASRESIENAFKEIELTENPKDYIIEVFLRIVDDTLPNQ